MLLRNQKRILYYGCVWMFSGFGCVSIGERKKEREKLEVDAWKENAGSHFFSVRQ